MTKNIQQLKMIGCTGLFYFLFILLLNAADQPNTTQDINKAEKLRFENPDSAIQLLDEYYIAFIEKRDTINAINSLTALATVYGNQANYRGSYDKLWKALLLAEQGKLDSEKVYIYLRLGQFYSYYNREEKAVHFLNKAQSLKNKIYIYQRIGNFIAIIKGEKKRLFFLTKL